MKKVNIVTLNGIGNEGGVERVNFYLKKLLEKKFDLDIIIKNKKRGKIGVIGLPILTSLELILKKGIVISNSYQSFLYRNDFLISHGTTLGYLKKNPNEKSLGSLMICMMEFLANNISKTILAVSEDTKKEIVEYYKVNPKKIKVLNNFVDGTVFYPQTFQEKNEKIVILFSGRLSMRKGVDKLLKLADAIEKEDKFELRIASNDKTNFEKFTNFKKTKILVGLNLENMNDFYNSGDILFFPSTYEGFSMATLEALSAGIPVIGTTQALKEEVRSYDFIELINSKEDAEEILKKIETLVEKWKDRRIEIHKKINKEFGVKSYTNKLYDILNVTGD
jgi:glycosyltransferase involved in cell wall biosynthesis